MTSHICIWNLSLKNLICSLKLHLFNDCFGFPRTIVLCVDPGLRWLFEHVHSQLLQEEILTYTKTPCYQSTSSLKPNVYTGNQSATQGNSALNLNVTSFFCSFSSPKTLCRVCMFSLTNESMVYYRKKIRIIIQKLDS